MYADISSIHTLVSDLKIIFAKDVKSKFNKVPEDRDLLLSHALDSKLGYQCLTWSRRQLQPSTKSYQLFISLLKSRTSPSTELSLLKYALSSSVTKKEIRNFFSLLPVLNVCEPKQIECHFCKWEIDESGAKRMDAIIEVMQNL